MRRIVRNPDSRHQLRSSTGRRKRACLELPELSSVPEDVLTTLVHPEKPALPNLSWSAVGAGVVAAMRGPADGIIKFDCAEGEESHPAKPSEPLTRIGQLDANAGGCPENQGRRRHSFACALPDLCGNDVYMHWQAAAAVVSPYQGLGSMTITERDLAVGLRLAGIAAKLITDAASSDDFMHWIHVLDAHLPGEWGQINHGKTFVVRFGNHLLQAVHEFQLAHLQSEVRALKIPSDYARCIDGFTPRIGESG